MNNSGSPDGQDTPFGPRGNLPGNLPQYESTSHPEDQPYFGHPTNGGYAGYQAAGFYGNSANGPVTPTATSGRPKGQVNWQEAISFGFRATFDNASLWILGAFLSGVALMALVLVRTAISFGISKEEPSLTVSSTFELLTSLLIMVAFPFLMRLALHETDKAKASWSDLNNDVHFWTTIAVNFLVSLISGVICLILLAPSLGTFANLMKSEQQMTLGAFVSAMLPTLGLMALAMLINFFITPLFSFMTWYAASGQAGVGAAIKAGFKSGRTHYVQILIYYFLMGLILFFGLMLSGGLLGLVLLPAWYLGEAHMFRQMAGNMPVQSI